MKNVLLILFIELLFNSCTYNTPSSIKAVNLLHQNYILNIDTEVYKLIKTGDTIVFKKTIDVSLRNFAWYAPQWEVDVNSLIKTDTCMDLSTSPHDTLICYIRGIVSK
jgi:hypothetical protein